VIAYDSAFFLDFFIGPWWWFVFGMIPTRSSGRHTYIHLLSSLNEGQQICPLNLAFFQIEGNLDSDLSFSGKKITKKSCDIEGDDVTLFTLKVYIYREIIFWEEIPFFWGGAHSYSY
jgi:hypothetical protein